MTRIMSSSKLCSVILGSVCAAALVSRSRPVKVSTEALYLAILWSALSILLLLIKGICLAIYPLLFDCFVIGVAFNQFGEAWAINRRSGRAFNASISWLAMMKSGTFTRDQEVPLDLGKLQLISIHGGGQVQEEGEEINGLSSMDMRLLALGTLCLRDTLGETNNNPALKLSLVIADSNRENQLFFALDREISHQQLIERILKDGKSAFKTGGEEKDWVCYAFS